MIFPPKSYTERLKKAKLQIKIFSSIQCSNFAGLSGPSPDSYIHKINTKRFNHVYLFDEDLTAHHALLNTVATLQNPTGKRLRFTYSNISMIKGDIENFLSLPDTFYDFDFCRSLEYYESRDILRKICKLPEFAITCAIRSNFTVAEQLSIIKDYVGHQHIYAEKYRESWHDASMIVYVVSKRMVKLTKDGPQLSVSDKTVKKEFRRYLKRYVPN